MDQLLYTRKTRALAILHTAFKNHKKKKHTKLSTKTKKKQTNKQKRVGREKVRNVLRLPNNQFDREIPLKLHYSFGSKPEALLFLFAFFIGEKAGNSCGSALTPLLLVVA